MSAYDYIVVGAGSAGCVLARRLLDALGCRVLLLEAGGPDDAECVHRTDVPSMTSMWGSPEFVWDYASTPQRELGGRVVPIPQGRVTGGGSSVNAMMYVRGNRRDFDGWAALGNDGWSYDEVLPYFRRSEDYPGGSPEYRGGGGPLKVVDYGSPSDASRAFVRAAIARGRADGTGDYNGPRQEGLAFFYQSTRDKDGRRSSTSEAFLRPVLGEPNLTLETGAVVTRLTVEGGRAAGVEYVKDGRAHRATAAQEVVVACGALGSPALLLRSGLGPAAHLREHGVEVVADLPGVGRNLQDHVLFGIGYESLRELPFPELLAEAGLFTNVLGGDGPDLQFFFGPVQFIDDRYRTDGPGFTFAPILLQPESRGEVRLRPGDPLRPLVDPHYLEAAADLRLLTEAVVLARELVSDAAFDSLRGRELAPGPGVTSPAALAEYVRASASTVWHPAGTCRMGRDDEAVVGPDLRVRGVDGLRVADASVMPVITRGNTNAATIMIAEKAADLVAASARR
ncbi:GMC family oxidoreductase [Nonomuraea sp. NPDC001684]